MDFAISASDSKIFREAHYLLSSSLWDEHALVIQRLLLGEISPCEDRERNTIPLLNTILKTGSLTKFKKGSDPINDSDSSLAMTEFSSEVQINACELRNALRNRQNEQELRKLAVVCKKANAIAKKQNYRILGKTDTIAACYVLVMQLVWLYELRNHSMWIHVGDITRTYFSKNVSKHLELMVTHSMILTALWIYGSDCTTHNLKLCKNYVLNALSLLFRNPKVSFKVGGKASLAMKEIESYLNFIQAQYKQGAFDISRRNIIDQYGFVGDIDIEQMISYFSSNEPQFDGSECRVTQQVEELVLSELWCTPPNLLAEDAEFCCKRESDWPVDDSPRDSHYCKKRRLHGKRENRLPKIKNEEIFIKVEPSSIDL